MTVTLSAPGFPEVELDDCAAGYIVRSVDIGPPEVREVVSPRPLVDGTIDRTRYAGSRAVAIDLAIVERQPVHHPAVWEPRASLGLHGAGWVTITEPLNLTSPILDLRVDLAAVDWRNGLQVVAGQYAPGDAGWLWAIDPLGRPLFLSSPTGVYFDLPGPNLLPNPSVETSVDGYEVVTSDLNILPVTGTFDPDAPDGDHVLLLTRGPGQGDVEVRTTPIPATPGSTYAAACAARLPAGRTGRGVIECLDAAGAVVASDSLSRPDVGGWGTLWAGAVEAPEGTTQIRMRAIGVDLAEGEELRLDAFKLVETTNLAPVPVADDVRTVVRFVVTPDTVSADVGPTLDGPWDQLYDVARAGPLHQSHAPITVGALPLTADLGYYGLTGNIYGGGAYDGMSGDVILSWDGYTLANIEGFPFVLGGDAESVAEPPVLISAAWVERFDTRRDLVDRVAPYLHPGVVSTLRYATDPDAPPRRVVVRPSDWSAPWENRWYLDTTLGFVTVGAPWALGDAKEYTLAPGSIYDPGRTYDLTFDRVYLPGGATSLHATNEGNAPAEWTATVFGPITGFTLVNTTTDERLVFPDLVVPAGQSVVIDSTTRTVLADGDPDASRYGAIDFDDSTWFRLRPGLNLLRVLSDTFSAPSQTLIRFADTYIL